MTSTPCSNGHEFSCDWCGEVLEPPRLGLGSEARDFLESWEDAKRKGWRAVKDGRDWKHKCPDRNCRTERRP